MVNQPVEPWFKYHGTVHNIPWFYAVGLPPGSWFRYHGFQSMVNQVVQPYPCRWLTTWLTTWLRLTMVVFTIPKIPWFFFLWLTMVFFQ